MSGGCFLKMVKNSLPTSPFEKKGNVVLLLLLPSLILIFGLLIYPLIYSFYISLLDFNLTRPGVAPFIGLNNYVRALSDDLFLSSFLRTIYFSVVTVCTEIVLGVAIALLLKQKFRGRGIVRGTSSFFLGLYPPWSTGLCGSGSIMLTMEL